jgi:exopolysaccharide biosynthesis protein
MKKIILFLFVSILSFSGCKKDNAVITEDPPTTGKYQIQTIQQGNLTIYNVDKFDATIVKIPKISACLYMQYPSIVEKIAADSNYSLVVNSSYFDNLPTGYFHSGYLKINNQVIAEYKVDKQLNRLFAYNTASNSVKFLSSADISSTTGYDLVFQTGPQIITNNTVDNASIDASINGSYVRNRTAFASVDNKTYYVIITREPVTLKDLGQMLLDTKLFTGELNVINFDGGPSTSLYLQNQAAISYNVKTRLPLLICVK